MQGVFLSGIAVLALCVPLRGADAVPFCALRFGYRYTQPDKWPEMRAALVRLPRIGAWECGYLSFK